jgi:lambda family phage portal protein
MPGLIRRFIDAVTGRAHAAADRRASEVAQLREQLQQKELERRQALSKVEAASGDEFNRRLWADADSLGPNAAFSDGVRQKVRDRGRHEAVNNGYARGLVRTHAYDLIGTAPRPQLTIPGDDDGALAEQIETNFARWAAEIRMGHKFRVMEKSVARDGDGFGLLVLNEQLKNPVKLDVRLAEAEQCQNPYGTANPRIIGGVELDEEGRKLAYWFLRRHPGEMWGFGLNLKANDFVRWPAAQVLHWFEQDRAGQLRGLPRITSALPTLGQLRRYTSATLTAAEFAAMIAGVLKTNLPPSTGVAQPVSAWSLFEVVKGALMALPEGYEATGMKNDQPTTTYGEFKRELLNECGRGSGAPLNVVSGNSSQYNFSSGRLDKVPYQSEKRIDRFDFEQVVSNPLFRAWEEPARMTGEVPANAPPVETWGVAWEYDGWPGIDQVKDATANDIRIKNGTATLAGVLADDGTDWRQHIQQLAKEKAYAESKGLPWPMLFNAPAAGSPAPQTEQDAVAAAMTEAGIPEQTATDVMDLLKPIFAARAKPSTNGHHKAVNRG